MEERAARSRIMRAVKGKNTGIELIVRSLTHSMGFRYRLHRKDLPGKPDLVFASKHRAIFVNGCFWHGHSCARGNRPPKTNRAYWSKKIRRNVERDTENIDRLAVSGWKVLVIWECEIKDVARLAARLRKFLGSANRWR